MKSILLLSLLLLIHPQDIFSQPSHVICAAPDADQFFKSLKAPGAAFGAFAQLDHTRSEACRSPRGDCGYETFADRGQPGYYEAHTVYFIRCGSRVIFAATSEYFEGTYGQRLGSAFAVKDLRAAWDRVQSSF